MHPTSLLLGAGLGAGLMYFLDREVGRRRRALVRDQAVHLTHAAGDTLDAKSRDLTNRTRGLVATTRSSLFNDHPDDPVLVGRVRSELGRVVSHPSAIEVTAVDGRVTLSGPVLAHEVDHLLSTVSRVRGVTDVENRLEVHQHAGDMSDLQRAS
jgi:hypothetical protein